MLPLRYRLTKKEDFSKVYMKGSFVAQEGVAIKYVKTGLEVSRIGFPVGKNFSKKAVDRNRARRVLRAAAAEHLSSLKPGFDLVVMIQGPKRDLTPSYAAAVLGRLLAKANLLM